MSLLGQAVAHGRTARLTRPEVPAGGGLPAVLGGVPLDELAAAAAAALGALARTVPGLHLLAERGGAVIAVSDSRGGTWNPGGLDVTALAGCGTRR